MRFYQPQYLWLFLAIPLLVVLMMAAGSFRRKAQARIGQPQTVNRLFGRLNKTARNLSLMLFLAGLAFMVAALARPQYPGGVERIEVRGGKVVVALDVSLSMLAQDFQPNRLEKAKREIVDLLDKLKAQTAGLVVFAGEAFVLCPPTVDYSAFRMFLDVADVGTISDTGTNLEDAIDESVKLLDDNSPAEKTIVIFTDGESFSGDDEKAASQAAKKGIRIYTIGVGSMTGRPLPDPEKGMAALKKDEQGQIVISRLDVERLEKIAQIGKGKFYRATPGERELDDLYADIKGLKGEKKEKKFRTLYVEKYRWLLAPGVSLMTLSFFIPQRRRGEYDD